MALYDLETWCPHCKETHKYGSCPLEGLCWFCNKNPATLHFGDALSATHFPSLNCCERCSVEKQLEHAREAAARIPELERIEFCISCGRRVEGDSCPPPCDTDLRDSNNRVTVGTS